MARGAERLSLMAPPTRRLVAGGEIAVGDGPVAGVGNRCGAVAIEAHLALVTSGAERPRSARCATVPCAPGGGVDVRVTLLVTADARLATALLPLVWPVAVDTLEVIHGVA